MDRLEEIRRRCNTFTDDDFNPISDHGEALMERLAAEAVWLLARHDSLLAEVGRLRDVLSRIQEMADHDINRGIVPDGCIIWQIEADARAALNQQPEVKS